MLEHVADAPSAVGRPAEQPLGIEWPRDPRDAVAQRVRARAKGVMQVTLEHEGVGRVE